MTLPRGMERIRAVFQVWLVASETRLVSAFMKVTTFGFGRLRQSQMPLGAVDWMVMVCLFLWERLMDMLESGVTTTNLDTAFQFVAFGIKNVGLWGA